MTLDAIPSVWLWALELKCAVIAVRLKKGPLPLEAAILYGTQLADALDKGHRAGVVHRDFKPGNIMLTKSGAKLTDYGLAKLKTTVEKDQELSALPTQEKPLTESGAILGTFQYMAPEQLEGSETDARTDIFGFGAVLYEMVTGKRAFSGKSQASLITAIMSAEPESLSELQPMTPRTLERIVSKCLNKDPDRRWQTAHDLMDVLKWALDGSESVATAPARRSRTILRVLSYIPLAGLTGIAGWYLKPAPAPVRPVTHWSMTLPPDEPAVANRPAVALSPDGRHLAYATSRQLYLRSMDRPGATAIPQSEGAYGPFFSPDG